MTQGTPRKNPPFDPLTDEQLEAQFNRVRGAVLSDEEKRRIVKGVRDRHPEGLGQREGSNGPLVSLLMVAGLAASFLGIIFLFQAGEDESGESLRDVSKAKASSDFLEAPALTSRERDPQAELTIDSSMGDDEALEALRVGLTAERPEDRVLAVRAIQDESDVRLLPILGRHIPDEKDPLVVQAVLSTGLVQASRPAPEWLSTIVREESFRHSLRYQASLIRLEDGSYGKEDGELLCAMLDSPEDFLQRQRVLDRLASFDRRPGWPEELIGDRADEYCKNESLDLATAALHLCVRHQADASSLVRKVGNRPGEFREKVVSILTMEPRSVTRMAAKPDLGDFLLDCIAAAETSWKRVPAYAVLAVMKDQRALPELSSRMERTEGFEKQLLLLTLAAIDYTSLSSEQGQDFSLQQASLGDTIGALDWLSLLPTEAYRGLVFLQDELMSLIESTEISNVALYFGGLRELVRICEINEELIQRVAKIAKRHLDHPAFYVRLVSCVSLCELLGKDYRKQLDSILSHPEAFLFCAILKDHGADLFAPPGGSSSRKPLDDYTYATLLEVAEHYGLDALKDVSLTPGKDGPTRRSSSSELEGL